MNVPASVQFCPGDNPGFLAILRHRRARTVGIVLLVLWIGLAGCATDPDVSELHKHVLDLQRAQEQILQREHAVTERLAEIESKLDEHDFLVGELIKTEEEASLDTRHLLDKLERMSARLREQIEQTRDSTRRRDRDLSIRVKALESRLENLVHGRTLVAPPSLTTQPPSELPPQPPSEPSPVPQREAVGDQPKPLNQASLFRSAYKAYLGGQYERATLEFSRFTKRFPAAALTPQAYYYLGDSHYMLKHHTEAAQAFQEIVQEFPGNQYVAPALYKLGLVMANMNQPAEAQHFWTKIIEEYPDSPEAELAKNQLSKLSGSS